MHSTTKKVYQKLAKIETSDRLLKYSLDKSRYTGFSVDEAIRAFYALPPYANDPQLLLNDLINIATGDLKKYLQTLNLATLSIKSGVQLVQFLYEKTNEGLIDREQLLKLMLQASDVYYMNDLLAKMRLYSSGKLHIYLTALIEKSNIHTITELITSLIDNSGPKSYSLEELASLLARIASENLDKIQLGRQAAVGITTDKTSHLWLWPLIVSFILLIVIILMLRKGLME
jgi:hypothetical protein